MSFKRNLPEESISRLTDETLVLAAEVREVNEDVRAIVGDEKRVLGSAEDEERALGSWRDVTAGDGSIGPK